METHAFGFRLPANAPECQGRFPISLSGDQMNTHRPHVLIFVVAYEAESTLQRVLDRIPRPMLERFDAEVLVIDDSSSDRTFEVGVRSAGASSRPITVFYNRTNQGYGGNQKLGYQYALRNGFEFVVLLHGDGHGDEICRVNGMLYAKNVMSATLISRLHRLNILYDRKFDIEWSGNAHYALKLGYDSSHTAALGAVPSGTRVMDIGCGPGGFDRLLVDKGCIVTGADQFPPVDRSIFEDFVVWNEQVPLEIRSGDYDYVLLLDIIEHLKQPEAFLDRLRHSLGSLDDRPKIIVTTGNVVFLIVRLQALLGNFNYGKQGILDLTHTRLYTFGTLRKLFEQCGFVVEEVRGIPAPFPAALGLNAFSRLLVRVNGFLIRLSRGLFSYQIFMRVAPTPTVDALLEDSMAGSITRASEARRAQQEEQRRRSAVQSASETPV